MNTPISPLPPLALIAGPTASGKSALAVALAERTNGVVINADSAQVYRDLRILSARPDAADEARAPHRLYGYRDGAMACSAADWAVDARVEIEESRAQGRLPILVGGSGLYLRTLIDGIAPVPAIDPEIREQVRALPLPDAFVALRHEDEEAASRIRPSDGSRIARALEVVRSTGKPLRHWQTEKSGGIGDSVRLHPLILLPPRDWLHARCDRRFATMMSDEGLAEARALIDRNLDPALPVMHAIGVPQIAALLRGEMDEAEALDAGRIATRQYAKRQYTWFNRQPPADWPRFTEALDERGMEAALDCFGDLCSVRRGA
jgi:tRNA dimethylallyltransferase